MTTESGPAPHAVPLPHGAEAARLIVYERFGSWAVALRRELADRDVRVYETRSVAGCWELLAQCPTSFLVAEITRPNVDALVKRMAWLARGFPLARVAVVAERTLAGCEWLAREAGAVHFTVSLRQVRPLADLATRHLHAAPRPRRSLTDEIWAGLPWGRMEPK
ncbi:MAG: hypothetical protein ACYTG0_28870 [Planctomycetota bacterium]|jgi:hypothetical protein